MNYFCKAISEDNLAHFVEIHEDTGRVTVRLPRRKESSTVSDRHTLTMKWKAEPQKELEPKKLEPKKRACQELSTEPAAAAPVAKGGPTKNKENINRLI